MWKQPYNCIIKDVKDNIKPDSIINQMVTHVNKLSKENYANYVINTMRVVDKCYTRTLYFENLVDFMHIYVGSLLSLSYSSYIQSTENVKFTKCLKLLNVNVFDPSNYQFDDITSILVYHNIASYIHTDISIDVVNKCYNMYNDAVDNYPTDYHSMCELFKLCSNLCPNRFHYNNENEQLIKWKQLIQIMYKKCIPGPSGPPGQPRINYQIIFDKYDKFSKDHMKNRVLFIMDNATYNSSDIAISLPFMKYFIDNNYILDVYNVNKIADKRLVHNAFDEKYSASTILPTYNIAIVVSHIIDLGVRFKVQSPETTTIGILGQLMTSGVLDYYVVPEWDIASNYTEKLIRLPGLGGGLPLTKYMPNSDDMNNEYNKDNIVHISLPMTGKKINDNLGPIWSKIRKILKKHKISPMYNIHLGAINDPIKSSILENLYIAPYIKTKYYKVFSDDEESYNTIMSQGDIILMPFPYTGYISTVHMLTYGKPIITLKDESRFSSQCSARILELHGITETIAYTVDQYIDIAVKCLTDKEFYNNISNKMKSIDYTSILVEHNEQIVKSFGDEIEKLGIL